MTIDNQCMIRCVKISFIHHVRHKELPVLSQVYVVFNSYDVFELFIFTFYEGISVLNLNWSTEVLLFYFLITKSLTKHLINYIKTYFTLKYVQLSYFMYFYTPTALAERDIHNDKHSGFEDIVRYNFDAHDISKCLDISTLQILKLNEAYTSITFLPQELNIQKKSFTIIYKTAFSTLRECRTSVKFSLQMKGFIDESRSVLVKKESLI